MRRMMILGFGALAGCVCLAPAAWAQYPLPEAPANQPGSFGSPAAARPIQQAPERYDLRLPSAPAAVSRYPQTQAAARRQVQTQAAPLPMRQTARPAPRYPIPTAYSQIGVQRAYHTQPVGVRPPGYQQQGAYLSRTPPGYPQSQVSQASYQAPAPAARGAHAPIYPTGPDSKFVGAGLEQNLMKAQVATPPGEGLPGARVYQQQPGQTRPSAAARSSGWGGRLRGLFAF